MNNITLYQLKVQHAGGSYTATIRPENGTPVLAAGQGSDLTEAIANAAIQLNGGIPSDHAHKTTG